MGTARAVPRWGTPSTEPAPATAESQEPRASTPPAITVAPDRLASTALALLERHRIGSAFVVGAEGRPEGLVTMLELLRVGVA